MFVCLFHSQINFVLLISHCKLFLFLFAVIISEKFVCVIVVDGRHRPRGRHEGDRYESASMMSSDIETTSYMDSSDDQSR